MATKVVMLVTGYLPLLHLLAVAAVSLRAPGGGWTRAGLGLATLYLLPPLGARLTALVLPLRHGELGMGERGFLAWWVGAQWQIVFNRLRLLEELLRLLPGAYSTWLRLWGARVGSLVYWSPGVEIVDRALVDVGDGAVLGLGARLAGHVLMPAEGGARLLVAPITVGPRALVGAYSVISPGVVIGEGQASPPLRALRPFTRWRTGAAA
jgi:hypothetical protein